MKVFKIFLIASFLILPVIISGCASSSELQTYEDSKIGLKFNYPSDWFVKKFPLNKNGYKDYLSVSSYQPVKSYSDGAPHLKYPIGGASIVFHLRDEIDELFKKTSKPSNSKKLNRIIDSKMLGEKAFVNKSSNWIPAPYMYVDFEIDSNKFRLELRTDKKGLAKGEKVFNSILDNIKIDS